MKSKDVSKSQTTVKSPAKLRSSPVKNKKQISLNIGDHDVPEGITDFDKENLHDIYQVSQYAMDIFNYLKSREVSIIFAFKKFNLLHYAFFFTIIKKSKTFC